MKMYKEYLSSEWMKKYAIFKAITFENFFLPSPFSIGYYIFPIFEKEYTKSPIVWLVESPISFGLLVTPLFILAIPFLFLKNHQGTHKDFVEYIKLLCVFILIFGFFLSLFLDKLIYTIPFSSLIGCPSRFAVFHSILTPVIVAYFMNEVVRKRCKGVYLFLLSLLLVDFFLFVFPFKYNGYYRIQIPKILWKIKNENESFTILNLPPTLNTQGMFLQTIHGKKILDGHVSRVPSYSVAYIAEMDKNIQTKQIETVIRILKKLDVKYVIVNHGYHHKKYFLQLLKHPALKLVDSSTHLEIYKIV
jgi:hypothetical protein